MRRIHVLITRLTPVLSLVFLVAACQSGPTVVPTAPATVPSSTGTYPGVPAGNALALSPFQHRYRSREKQPGCGDH